MHKILRLVRELMPDIASSAKSEVFSSSLSLLDEMLAPYASTRKQFAFCFGAQLWSDMLCEPAFIDAFVPTTSHANVIEGFVGCYKHIGLYTDAFADDKFLSPRHLVLAMLTEDGEAIEALFRVETTVGFRPNKTPAVGTVTQWPPELVERRAKMIAQLNGSPGQAYYAERDERAAE